MSITDYTLPPKKMQPLNIQGETDYDAVPEIGVIGGGKVAPKALTDRELLSASGWTFNTSYMARDTGTASTSAGMSPVDYPFFGGSTYANRATAPFRVTTAGALVATSATITGSITATSGTIGGWTIGATTISAGSTFVIDSQYSLIRIGAATDLLVGDGVFLRDTSGGVIRAGTVAASALTRGILWDGTNFSWIGVNASLTAAGAFTASNATITGAITATSGSLSGLSVTGTLTLSGSGKLITAASPAARIELDTTQLAGYSDATTKQVYLSASDGLLYAGGGNAGIDNTGLWILPTVSSGYFRIQQSGDASSIAKLFGVRDAVTPANDYTALYSFNHGTGATIAYLSLAASSTLSATSISLTASTLTALLTTTGLGIGLAASYLLHASLSSSGATVTGAVGNTSNTANSNARQFIEVAGTSAGDPFIGLSISGGQQYAIGIDNSNSDKLVISASAALGTTDVLTLDSSSNLTNTGAHFTNQLYPGNQTTRFISDNATNIVVDSVVVATHTHNGANQGGTVPMSAVSGTISTTQHGALGAITNAHAVADINGAAPLASPTFTGTVALPTATVSTDIYSVTWTNYAPSSTVTGWSSFGTAKIMYRKLGKLVFVYFELDGTSDATTVSFTLPYANAANAQFDFASISYDNGVFNTTPARGTLPASSSTVTIYSNFASAAWTGSGPKVVRGQFFYETT